MVAVMMNSKENMKAWMERQLDLVVCLLYSSIIQIVLLMGGSVSVVRDSIKFRVGHS